MRLGLALLAPQILLFAPETTDRRWEFLTGKKGLSAAQARWELFRTRDEFARKHGAEPGPDRT